MSANNVLRRLQYAQRNQAPTAEEAIMKFEDYAALDFGTGAGVGLANQGDLRMRWDGTDFDILQLNTNSSIKLGVSGAGIDVQMYGDTVGADMLWDQSADSLIFGDNGKVVFGTGSDVTIRWDATDLDVLPAADDSIIKFGDGTLNFDLWFYGNAATTYWSWDASADSMKFEDNCFLGFGTNTAGPGTKGDINITWNGTKLLVAQTTTNSAIDWGVDGAGIDMVFYGDTASANVTWDQSADRLTFNGAAATLGLRTASTTAVAITGATVLTLADSGGIFTVSQGAAYDIDLPSPTTGAGCRYLFQLVSPGANNVTITVTGAAATFEGTIVNDVTSVIVATGSTLTFASGASALGDWIEAISTATGKYFIRAVTSAAGGITVA